MIEGIRVLLVMDHDLLREGMRRFLEEQPDIEIIGESGDEEEAVRQAYRTKPDIIMLDIAQSRINNAEVTRRFRDLLPSATIVVLTAYEHKESVWNVLDAGGGGHLRKNLKEHQMIEAIHALQHRDRVFHTALARKVMYRYQKKSFPRLSNREMEIVRLASSGFLNKEIALKLGLGERTVQTHWRNIFNKLGVSSRVEVLMFCLRKGWLELELEVENDRT